MEEENKKKIEELEEKVEKLKESCQWITIIVVIFLLTHTSEIANFFSIIKNKFFH